MWQMLHSSPTHPVDMQTQWNGEQSLSSYAMPVGNSPLSWEEISLLGQVINWKLSGCHVWGQEWAWGNFSQSQSHQQYPHFATVTFTSVLAVCHSESCQSEGIRQWGARQGGKWSWTDRPKWSMGSMQVRLREEGLVHLHTFCEH